MTDSLAAELEALARAEHEEGEIGGTAYDALHLFATQNADLLVAALRLAGAVGECYTDGCDHNCGVAWHAEYEKFRSLTEAPRRGA